MSKVDPNNVLKMLRVATTTMRSFVPVAGAASTAATVIDLAQAAAQIRHDPVRQNQSIMSRACDGDDSAVLDKAVAFVENHLPSLYSGLKRDVRQKMVADISRQLVGHPHTRELIERLPAA